MRSVDALLDRIPRPDYTCRHFLREAWLHLTDEDLLERIPSLFQLDEMPSLSRGDSYKVVQLDTPETPCVVLMQADKGLPHVGIYIDGSILHLACYGVQFQPPVVAFQGFRKIRYYK